MTVSIPKLLAKYMKQSGKPIGVRALTLLKSTPGTRTAASGGTNPTTASYAGSGLVEMLQVSDYPGLLVQIDDRKIGILGGSLAAGIVPSTNDKVTIVDVDGTSKTFKLIAVISGDGVGAMFEFQARL